MRKKLIIMLLIIVCLSRSLYIYAIEDNTSENENKEEIEEKTYSDLKETHWAYDAILDMSNKGILSGFPDGTFGVNSPITKEAYATMFVKAFDLETADSMTNTFEDVQSNKWSYKYVEAVKKYVHGNMNNNKLYFSPKENISREDVIASLVLLLGLDEETVDLTVLNKYSDNNEISQDIRGLVATAIANQMISGDGKKINPKKNLTRAEASMIIYKLIKREYKIESKLDDTFGTKQVMYNDGYVKFNYPILYKNSIVKLDGNIKENENMKSYNLEKDKIKISLYYTTDPNTISYTNSRGIGTNILTDILKSLNRGIYTEYEKNNYNNNYILMNYTSIYGHKIHIFGRGIDNLIPQIVVKGNEKRNNAGEVIVKTEGEIFNEDKIITEVSDVIRNSFKVVSNIKSFKSPGLDKNVMETFPVNGQNDVDSNMTFEIRCNAQVGWGAKYILKDDTESIVSNVNIYYATVQNILKMKFEGELESGKTYILEPEILNDIDGNFINGGSIRFSVR